MVFLTYSIEIRNRVSSITTKTKVADVVMKVKTGKHKLSGHELESDK